MRHILLFTMLLTFSNSVMAGEPAARPDGAQRHEKLREYLREHPEAREKAKEWLQAHPEARGKFKEWLQAHPEAREKLKERLQEWREQHPDAQPEHRRSK